MGGTESEYFGKFKTYCCEAYNILRYVVLILNLSLMADANIRTSARIAKALLKLESSLRLTSTARRRCSTSRFS